MPLLKVAIQNRPGLLGFMLEVDYRNSSLRKSSASCFDLRPSCAKMGE
jgi:hypothetical protein